MIELLLSKESLGVLSVLVLVTAYISYFRAIFARTIKPHMFSWIIWGTITAIAFVSQVSDNAGAGSWVMGATALACFIIAGLGFLYGEKDITKSDWIVFLCALSAIPVWILTETPFWSVIIVTVIDILGFAPTIRKSWAKPYEEDLLMYTLSSFKFLIAWFALEAYTFITAFYLIALVVINIAFVFLLIIRRHQVSKQTSPL